MKKKLHLRSLLLLSLLLIAGLHSTSYAVNDDPGAGRLSGTDIPEEFYEEADPAAAASRIKRYGTFQSVSPYTNKTYTHQDQFTGCTIINGIDVSEYQKTIDWAAVKAAGIDFAFIRVGGRGWGKTGSMYNDSTYGINMQNAAAAGVNTGIYVFSQAITEAEAVEEAQFILDRIGTYTVNMPLILDYEFASTGTSEGGRLRDANLSKEEATNVCLAFCQTIAAAGYTPMVYANPDMLNNHLNASTISASYPIWLANYTTSTSYNGTFTYWQYSSTGSVPGITGNVDMNFYYAAPTGSLASAVITPIADQTYNGSAHTPSFTVTLDGKVLTPNLDYTIQYSNNINVGTATITITGANGYFGTRTIIFNIVPKAMSTLNVKKRSTNYITLSWSKASNVTGYQIYRASAPDGSYKKIKTVTNKSTTSYKNSGLTAGQCYYYKIRTYITSNGQTYYGEYSPIRAIYTNTGYTRLALGKSGAAIYNTTSTDGVVVINPTPNAAMTVTYSTLDAAGNTWYHVTYETSTGDFTGFIPSGQVTIAKQGKINGSKVNVRKSASITSTRLTRLSRNKKVIVLKTKTKKGVTWYKVTFKKSGKTYNGWIAHPYVKII
ncbi:MAG: GH25 family lysozyme [Lachnospiraceae bacterium]